MVSPGSLKILPNQGMPSYRNHDMGDLIVQINVTFPETLDPALLAPLESILPSRPELPTFPKNISLDDSVELVNADDRRVRSGGREDAMEEDEEGAGPQVQCAKYVVASVARQRLTLSQPVIVLGISPRPAAARVHCQRIDPSLLSDSRARNW